MRSSIITSLAALVAGVYAHGYVDNITIAGTTYTVSNTRPSFTHPTNFYELGIPTIHRSILQPHSKPNCPTSPGQWAHPRLDTH
jgi:hypothetical protein